MVAFPFSLPDVQLIEIISEEKHLLIVVQSLCSSAMCPADADEADDLTHGTVLAHGRRTVCAALRLSGEADNAHWSSFHQVLNRARWSELSASCCLLRLIVDTLLPAEAVIEIAIDEMLERRWGPQIHKRGHFRESALSSRKQSVSRPGLRWIVMAVVAPVPFCQQPWALPFLVVLATTPGVSQ